MSQEAGLAKGTYGIIELAVMGVAGTAPALSLAVTRATIVAGVGTLSAATSTSLLIAPSLVECTGGVAFSAAA